MFKYHIEKIELHYYGKVLRLQRDQRIYVNQLFEYTMASTYCIRAFEKKMQMDEEVPEEKLVHYKEYYWTMYDGEKFHRIVKDPYNEPIPDEYLNDVITFGNALLVWDDANGRQSAYLRAPEISFKYVINSILYHYKRTRTTPEKVCMLDGLYYNPFDRVIRVVFGS